MTIGSGIPGSYAGPLTSVRTNAQGPEVDLGSIRLEDGKWYKYVQYKATAVACVAGSAVGPYAPDGFKLHQVTMDTSDQEAAATGLCMGVAVGLIPTDGYGWIQVTGHCTMVPALAGGVDGQPLTLSGATADTGDFALVDAIVEHVAAYAGDASDKEVILCCPL